MTDRKTEIEKGLVMVKQMNRVGIIGATGYVAMELVRILAGHSGLKLSLLVSHSQAGSLFSDI